MKIDDSSKVATISRAPHEDDSDQDDEDDSDQDDEDDDI